MEYRCVRLEVQSGYGALVAALLFICEARASASPWLTPLSRRGTKGRPRDGFSTPRTKDFAKNSPSGATLSAPGGGPDDGAKVLHTSRSIFLDGGVQKNPGVDLFGATQRIPLVFLNGGKLFAPQWRENFDAVLLF